MRFILFLTLFLFHGTFNSIGATSKSAIEFSTGSMVTLLKVAKEDSIKVNVLNELSRLLNHYKPKEAIKYAESGIPLAQNLNLKKQESSLLLNMGIGYQFLDDYNNSMTCLQRSLKIFKEINYQAGQIYVLYSTGKNYFAISNYPMELDYLHQALKIFLETDQKNNEADAFLDIGAIYDDLGKHFRIAALITNSSFLTI